MPTRIIYKKAKWWLFIGAILNLLIGIVVVYFTLSGIEPEILRGSDAFLSEYEAWVGHYGYQFFIQATFAVGLTVLSPLWVFWQVAGLMLLGVYFYRIGFFKRGLRPTHFKFCLLSAVFLTMIDLIIRWFFLGAGNQASALFASISAIFMSILYIHGVIYLLNNQHTWLNIFKAPGRMAFTLYIMQSIVLAILLRWIYPEIHLYATMAEYMGIAMIFIVFQVVFANWYMHHFSQGPLEALWRKAYLTSFANKAKA